LKPSAIVKASGLGARPLTAEQAAQLAPLVALVPKVRAEVLRRRLAIMKVEIDALERDIRDLWSQRRSIAALVDKEPYLAKEFGLLATRLERVSRLPVIADVVAPLVRRARAFAGGRRRNALDPLDRVLVEILKHNPDMASDDVLKALKHRAGDGGVIVRVRQGVPHGSAPGHAKTRGRRIAVTVVDWRHPETGDQHTAWSTIRTHRLSRVRGILLAKPQ
jgi:hypothetical protein